MENHPSRLAICHLVCIRLIVPTFTTIMDQSTSPEKRPKLSTAPLTDPGQNNLLDRIRSFLPAIQQANEQLEQATTNADPTVLDESDDDDDSETEAAEETGSTFKLKLAQDNDGPAASPSASDDDDGPAEDINASEKRDDDDDDDEAAEKEKKQSAIGELLKPSASRKRQGGPLIQEIS